MSDQPKYSSEFIDRLGPEGVQAMLEMGALDEQSAMLADQMQRAHALRRPGPERYGALGAGLQGAADLLNQYNGLTQERGIDASQQKLIGDRNAARQRYGTALFKMGEQPQGYAGMGGTAYQPPQAPAFTPPNFAPPQPPAYAGVGALNYQPKA